MNPKIKAIVDKAIEEFEEFADGYDGEVSEAPYVLEDTKPIVHDLLEQVATQVELLN